MSIFKANSSENSNHQPLNSASSLSSNSSATSGVQSDDTSLLEELRRQSRELEVFQQIRTTMLYSLDLNRIFDMVVSTIASAFDFGLVSIYLLENDELQLKAQYGYKHFQTVLPANQGINWRVIHSGYPLFLTNLAAPTATGNLEVAEGADSLICVPLLNRGHEALGTLSVASYPSRPLDQRDLQLSQSLAEQIVLALNHILSYKREQRRAEQLSLLNQVGRDLAAAQNVQTIIDRVTGPVRKSLGLYSVSIALIEAGELVYMLGEGSNLKETRLQRPLTLDCLSCQCVKTGELMIVQDVSREPGYLPISSGLNTKSEVLLPLRAEGRIFGLLEVESDRLYAFDDDDVILLKTLADQTSIALTNAMRIERLQLQRVELSQKNLALAEASRLKSEFIANISHELRTPLNSIIGYIDMIRTGYFGDVPTDFNNPLERVERNGHQLLALINDVLDLSKIEAGKMRLDPERFSLPELVIAVYEATESQANLKQLDFNYLIDPEAPRIVSNDQLRLRQILLNLVSNAIKFTRKGYVKIEVKPVAVGVLPIFNGAAYHIIVSDSGIGIPENEFENIFEEFRQVDGSTTREFGGTGLGLSICRRITRLMGGTITVESVVNEGSRFTVTLPLEIETKVRK